MSPVLMSIEVILRNVSVLLTPCVRLSACIQVRNLLATLDNDILASLSCWPVTTDSSVLKGFEQILSLMENFGEMVVLFLTLLLLVGLANLSTVLCPCCLLRLCYYVMTLWVTSLCDILWHLPVAPRLGVQTATGVVVMAVLGSPTDCETIERNIPLRNVLQTCRSILL